MMMSKTHSFVGSIIMVIAFPCVAHDQLSMSGIHYADLDDMTLATLAYQQITKGNPKVQRFSTSQQRFSSSQQQRSFPQFLPQAHTRPWMPSGYTRAMRPLQAASESTDSSTSPEVSPTISSNSSGSASDEGYINIFEETLDTCVPETQFKKYSDYCTYRSADFALHQICASALPARQGRTKWEEDWNDNLLCMSIWDYAKKGAKGYYAKGLSRAGAASGVDFVPKCEALPAGVLESSYSMATYRRCYVNQRKYFFTPDQETPGTMKLTTEVDSEESQLCLRFRAAIDSICDTCALQANSDAAKESLQSKCEAIRSQAAQPGAVQPAQAEEDLQESSVSILSVVSLIGLSLVGGFTFTLMRSLRCFVTATEDSLLSA
jgi:hypothetical protein